MIQAIDVYMAGVLNPYMTEFYAEVFEGMSILQWEAVEARQNMEICNPEAWSRIGWNGFMMSGS